MNQCVTRTGDRGRDIKSVVFPTPYGFKLRALGPKAILRGHELTVQCDSRTDAIDMAVRMLGDQPALLLAKNPDLVSLARMIMAVQPERPPVPS